MNMATAQTVFRPALGINLAAVAGYVDTLGFVALFGLFTAHVTGNFVLIGNTLIGNGQGVLLKLLAFPAFISGVVVTRLLMLRTGRSLLRQTLLMQAALLLVCMAAGLYALPIQHPDAPLVMFVGLLATFAMGIQNAQSRLTLVSIMPTTVMTGNVTQVVLDMVDLLAGSAMTDRDALRARLARMAPPVIAFACGAIAGAFAFHFFSFWALLLPVIQLAGAALLAGEQ